MLITVLNARVHVTRVNHVLRPRPSLVSIWYRFLTENFVQRTLYIKWSWLIWHLSSTHIEKDKVIYNVIQRVVQSGTVPCMKSSRQEALLDNNMTCIIYNNNNNNKRNSLSEQRSLLAGALAVTCAHLCSPVCSRCSQGLSHATGQHDSRAARERVVGTRHYVRGRRRTPRVASWPRSRNGVFTCRS